MIGRKTAIGFSLLCALLVCAFAAQSALGAAATNTTGYTCVKHGGAKDFSDVHCNTKVSPGTGTYGHEVISTFTFLSFSNVYTNNNTTEATPAVIKSTVFGVKNEITCKTVSGEATLDSKEEGKFHPWSLKVVITLFTSCTVNKPALGCKVKEPIEFNLKAEGVEGLGAGKNEMGVEFKPAEGETFGEFTIEGCFIKGTYKLTGTAIATGNPAPTEKQTGATQVFTNAMTKETLKLAGSPAEISSAKTFTMKGGGGPVTFTTTT